MALTHTIKSKTTKIYSALLVLVLILLSISLTNIGCEDESHITEPELQDGTVVDNITILNPPTSKLILPRLGDSTYRFDWMSDPIPGKEVEKYSYSCMTLGEYWITTKDTHAYLGFYPTAGDYTFIVKAVYTDGSESRFPATCKFNVELVELGEFISNSAYQPNQIPWFYIDYDGIKGEEVPTEIVHLPDDVHPGEPSYIVQVGQGQVLNYSFDIVDTGLAGEKREEKVIVLVIHYDGNELILDEEPYVSQSLLDYIHIEPNTTISQGLVTLLIDPAELNVGESVHIELEFKYQGDQPDDINKPDAADLDYWYNIDKRNYLDIWSEFLIAPKDSMDTWYFPENESDEEKLLNDLYDLFIYFSKEIVSAPFSKIMTMMDAVVPDDSDQAIFLPGIWLFDSIIDNEYPYRHDIESVMRILPVFTKDMWDSSIIDITPTIESFNYCWPKYSWSIVNVELAKSVSDSVEPIIWWIESVKRSDLRNLLNIAIEDITWYVDTDCEILLGHFDLLKIVNVLYHEGFVESTYNTVEIWEHEYLGTIALMPDLIIWQPINHDWVVKDYFVKLCIDTLHGSRKSIYDMVIDTGIFEKLPPTPHWYIDRGYPIGDYCCTFFHGDAVINENTWQDIHIFIFDDSQSAQVALDEKGVHYAISSTGELPDNATLRRDGQLVIVIITHSIPD